MSDQLVDDHACAPWCEDRGDLTPSGTPGRGDREPLARALDRRFEECSREPVRIPEHELRHRAPRRVVGVEVGSDLETPAPPHVEHRRLAWPSHPYGLSVGDQTRLQVSRAWKSNALEPFFQ